jgi:Na+/H+ antiporter NhaA
MNAVRLGVLLGSVVSGLFGYVILRSAPQKALTAEDHPATG